MKITDEQIEKANYINLPQFLMMHGFDLKRVGKEYVWKEHDSLHIKDNAPGERGQWFRFSENKGGDNISFLRECMNMSFADAVEALTGEYIDRTYTAPTRTYQPKPVQQTARELSLAEADNCRRVFAYLCKTRELDYDLISYLIKSGVIAQEQKTGNVLFKYYDKNGKIIGAEKVGTSTEHKFKGIATGSAGGHGFEIVRGSGENAFFFESAIDMLSYLQMHDKELTNCRLVSMMGVKSNIVLDTMARHDISPENVFLCSDNDTAGNEFADRLREEYPDMKRIVTPDTYKDWNDMLRGISKITEQKKEADMQLYGNKMWNDATDNRDKSLISMQSSDFQRMQGALEKSGINYYAYEMNGTVRMAVNDKDVDWLKNILGDVSITKSNRPYSPPEKNIIGNAEYRYIPQKEYLSADRDLVLKMAELMNNRGIQFSGRIYPTGKGTLTVSHNDIYAVREIQKSVIEMRKQLGMAEKGQEVGNQEYRQNRDTHYYMSKLTPEQFKEVKPFLETSVNYHAVAKDGKVAFAVDKENAPAFHRALQNAEREVGMLRNMSDLDLPMEKNAALSPVIHRLAVEDMQFNLADFFDKRYDNAQFGEMLSLVNAYLSQAPAERYGENSKLNEMLEAKSSFDRAIEVSDFFSQHDFSDEQRAAITAMFVGDVTRGQIDIIDETFTAEDIQAYDEILHNALQESDVANFLTAHKQAVIDRENAVRVPTEEEVLFPKVDLAKFLAERSLSSDEWEDMALQLDVPDCEYKVVQVEATPFQQELVQELADRADAINGGNVDPSIDNMLKITSDGRKLGLDPRLIDPSFEDNPETKLNRCVENVARIHAETAEDKLTQIIFCDLGVPHKAAGEAAVEGEDSDDAKDKKSIAEVESLEEECDFCVYDDIRDKLIAKGVPAEEIAYIHDAKTEKQKSELFDKVRSGEVRVLLGSTAKMGTGTNVQKKLIAVHDLDIPWRPADLERAPVKAAI